MTDQQWTQRPEAERLLERLQHFPASQTGNTPEADTLLLEVIARMCLALDDRAAETQAQMTTAAQGVLATMRVALPIFRAMLTKLSEPPRAPEPTQTADDTSQPDTLAELVRETYASPGVIRSHVGPSGHAQLLEPGEVLQARPLNLMVGDVVTNGLEYPHGFSPRMYLGRISHPVIADRETLIWWTDEGSALSANVDRMEIVGIVLPSTDGERQVRLARWTEAMD